MAAAGTFGLVCVETGVPGWIRTVVQPSDLGLRVDRTATGLLVRWNHRSRPVWKASGGTLNIHDGPYSRTLQLDAGQIAAGSILYEEQTGDVTFELNVHSQSGSIAEESVRVLGPTALGPRASSLDFRPVPAAAPPEVEREETHIARRNRAFGQPAWLTSVHKPERQLRAAALIAEAPILPQHVLSQQVGGNPALAGLISSSSALRQAPPFRGAALLASYLPPRIVREVKPDLRLLGLPSSPITVRIQVSIDELGRVINATAESGTGNTHSELTKAALEAARKWLFAPAVLHGKKIPSGQTILFEFRPSRR